METPSDVKPRGTARLVVAAVSFLIGVVWIGQGIGLIKGSFMTDQAIWAVIGAVMVLLAVSLLKGVARDRKT